MQPSPPWWEGAALIIPRDLCRFEFYEPPAQLSGSDAVKAARTRLSVAGPFSRSGGLMVRRGKSFGLWWWDQDLVRTAAGSDASAVKVLTEALITEPGDGYRLIRTLGGGAEAQYWREGFLLASAYRPEAWTHQDWELFVRTTPDDSPVWDIPPISRPPLAWTNGYRRVRVRLEPLSTLLASAAVVIAALCLAISGFFLGQAAHLNQTAARLEAEISGAPEATPPQVDIQARAQLAELARFSTAVGGTDPLGLIAEAASVLDAADAEVRNFSIEQGRLEIGTSPTTLADAESIARSLEMSPSFSNVSARIEETGARDLVFEMDVVGAINEPASPGNPPTP